MKKNVTSIALAIMMSGMLSMNAHGNAMEISPLKIRLSGTNPVGTFQLTNKSQETVYLQLKPAHWKQSSGTDIYTDTDNIIVTPPIATIQPGKTQLIRLTLRTPNETDTENAYRLYIQEIPRFHPGTQGVGFNLRLGVPVFAEPVTPSPRVLQWKGGIQNGSLTLTAINNSHYHCRISRIRINSNGNNHTVGSLYRLIYLLPRQTVQLHFPLTARLDSEINVETKSDWGVTKTRLRI